MTNPPYYSLVKTKLKNISPVVASGSDTLDLGCVQIYMFYFCRQQGTPALPAYCGSWIPCCFSISPVEHKLCPDWGRCNKAKASFRSLVSGGGHHHYDGEQEALSGREIHDENVLSLKMKAPQCENEAEMKLTPHNVWILTNSSGRQTHQQIKQHMHCFRNDCWQRPHLCSPWCWCDN